MESLYRFIIKPKGERYDNEKKVGDKSLITNTRIETFQSVSKKAIVIALPKAYKTDIKVGDEVIIHHNVFRRFYDMKEEGWKTDKSSIWYTMSIDEMNEINSKSNELDIRISNEPKFDGSLLIISADLIRAGVNIPHACYACGEDASFERMCKIIMGKSYVQFIIKNILKVHNRVHPMKREYVLGEKEFQNVKQKRKSNNRWQEFHKICEHNLYTLGENQTKFKNVGDIND